MRARVPNDDVDVFDAVAQDTRSFMRRDEYLTRKSSLEVSRCAIERGTDMSIDGGVHEISELLLAVWLLDKLNF